jgi:hypothetical protein
VDGDVTRDDLIEADDDERAVSALALDPVAAGPAR